MKNFSCVRKTAKGKEAITKSLLLLALDKYYQYDTLEILIINCNKMHKDIDKGIVREHIRAVVEEKTRQLADHLINVRTLEKKILRHDHFLKDEVERFEKDLAYMAGKKESQTQKYMSGMEDEDKKNLTKYVQQKNNHSSLEYAEKAIVEHEEFLSVLKSLGEEIEDEIETGISPSTTVSVQPSTRDR